MLVPTSANANAYIPPGPPGSPGTATATAGQVNLDLQLLGGLLGILHLPGSTGLDVPLANLVLGQAVAPNAAGDAANFTNSTLRLRDDLIAELNLPGPEADLLKADAVSGTARVIEGPGAYTQAYATVTNLRLFLPLVNLPGADASNGVLKVDAVSAQATCVPGQQPVASAKLPTTVLLLGHSIPVPLSGDIPLNVGVAQVDVHLSPTTVVDGFGASSAVEARISVDAVGLAKVSGTIILASAACTTPGISAAANPAAPSTSAGTSSSTAPASVAGTANASGGSTQGLGTLGSVASTGGAVGNPALPALGPPFAGTAEMILIWPVTVLAAVAILTTFR